MMIQKFIESPNTNIREEVLNYDLLYDMAQQYGNSISLHDDLNGTML